MYIKVQGYLSTNIAYIKCCCNEKKSNFYKVRGRNMHINIYSIEDFDKKQAQYVKNNIFKPVMLKQYLPESNIIKNYVYYDEPFKIS